MGLPREGRHPRCDRVLSAGHRTRARVVRGLLPARAGASGRGGYAGLAGAGGAPLPQRDGPGGSRLEEPRLQRLDARVRPRGQLAHHAPVGGEAAVVVRGRAQAALRAAAVQPAGAAAGLIACGARVAADGARVRDGGRRRGGGQVLRDGRRVRDGQDAVPEPPAAGRRAEAEAGRRWRGAGAGTRRRQRRARVRDRGFRGRGAHDARQRGVC
mmetsp:Transcript_64755/g.177549  ORF Transcript_64755/g.177549 Transcript_64755/m.177549 type:complete len:213 (+) Transcript_64755:50-688(+)